jgi:TPR repeat protein
MVSSGCRSGYASAQNNLAMIGRGVQQNYAEGIKWSRLAAEQGLAAAQYELAAAYANGQGVPQNYTEAVKWARLSADHFPVESTSAQASGTSPGCMGANSVIALRPSPPSNNSTTRDTSTAVLLPML